MKRTPWSCFALLLAVPVMAVAADGYVTGNVNLRAGPDVGYPVISVLPAGTPVAVQGCTQDWGWCDVIAYNDRGWMAGNFIQYDYDNQPVLLPQYGAQIGIPIVSFVISTYWDDYYRDRPFYRDRDRWYSRPMPWRPPPPPLGRPLRPIHPPPPRGPVAPRPPGPRPPMQPPMNNRWQPGHAPYHPPFRPAPNGPGGEHRGPPAHAGPGSPPQGHPAYAPARKEHGQDGG